MAGFAIDAILLRQKGWELYCFEMDSERLRRICYVVVTNLLRHCID